MKNDPKGKLAHVREASSGLSYWALKTADGVQIFEESRGDEAKNLQERIRKEVGERHLSKTVMKEAGIPYADGPFALEIDEQVKRPGSFARFQDEGVSFWILNAGNARLQVYGSEERAREASMAMSMATQQNAVQKQMKNVL